MLMLTCLLILPGQIDTVDAADFSRELQIRTITATVHIVNAAKKTQGSGVIVGRDKLFVYVLTAQHVVKGADRLLISTYAEKPYPEADKVNRDAQVVAELKDAKDIRDLALVRMPDDGMFGVLPICPVSDIPKGEGFQVLSCGCSEANAPTCQVNKVSGSKRFVLKAGDTPASFWEWLADVPKGRSGGPLIDKRGYVIGICSGTTKNGKGYYSRPEEIHRFLEENSFEWLAPRKK
jgi:S1-C subfamily serine protease